MGVVDERQPQRNKVWEIQPECYYNGSPIWTEEIVSEYIKFLEQEKNDKGIVEYLKGLSPFRVLFIAEPGSSFVVRRRL